jgi:hypothetical protein
MLYDVLHIALNTDHLKAPIFYFFSPPEENSATSLNLAAEYTSVRTNHHNSKIKY